MKRPLLFCFVTALLADTQNTGRLSEIAHITPQQFGCNLDSIPEVPCT
jgi:hypothetical protein